MLFLKIVCQVLSKLWISCLETGKTTWFKKCHTWNALARQSPARCWLTGKSCCLLRILGFSNCFDISSSLVCLTLSCICIPYKSLSSGLSVVLSIGTNKIKHYLCGLFGGAAQSGSTISPGTLLQSRESGCAVLGSVGHCLGKGCHLLNYRYHFLQFWQVLWFSALHSSCGTIKHPGRLITVKTAIWNKTDTSG